MVRGKPGSSLVEPRESKAPPGPGIVMQGTPRRTLDMRIDVHPPFVRKAYRVRSVSRCEQGDELLALRCAPRFFRTGRLSTLFSVDDR